MKIRVLIGLRRRAPGLTVNTIKFHLDAICFRHSLALQTMVRNDSNISKRTYGFHTHAHLCADSMLTIIIRPRARTHAHAHLQLIMARAQLSNLPRIEVYEHNRIIQIWGECARSSSSASSAAHAQNEAHKMHRQTTVFSFSASHTQ